MADPVPWFRARPRPGSGDEPPGVDLLRRGDPETGDPKVDCWRDTGTRYVLEIADAVALRDSLAAALREIGAECGRIYYNPHAQEDCVCTLPAHVVEDAEPDCWERNLAAFQARTGGRRG